jgi:hypothetical protein
MHNIAHTALTNVVPIANATKTSNSGVTKDWSDTTAWVGGVVRAP